MVYVNENVFCLMKFQVTLGASYRKSYSCDVWNSPAVFLFVPQSCLAGSW